MFLQNNIRKYTCFVCGTEFTEFPEYIKHIISTHEEGREYLLCPLNRCKAPVRDIRSHFKVYHKNDKIPNNIQLKTLIWKDFSKTKKRKAPHFKEGYFVSLKNNGKCMHFRSGYEESVYKILESMNTVNTYAVEPIEVPYFFNGKSKRYFPDLIVFFTDGHVEVWEIKPKTQKLCPVNLAKWNACKEYCRLRNWNFEVITETEIQKLQKLFKG